jgi:hypothetical protein
MPSKNRSKQQVSEAGTARIGKEVRDEKPNWFRLQRFPFQKGLFFTVCQKKANYRQE